VEEQQSEQNPNVEPHSQETVPAQNLKVTFLARGQKLALIGLVVFGFFLVTLWIIQFNSTLVRTFKPVNPDGSSDTTATADNVDEASKTKDTDGDGLTDWAELNTYGTSPYLEDTDGDSILDGNEIKKGTDPKCAQGKACNMPSIDTLPTSTPVTSLNIIPENNPTTTTKNIIIGSTSTNVGLTPGNVSTEEMQKILNGQIDIASLRLVLKNAGMDQKVLDKLSDQELAQLYQEQLKSK